MNLLAVENSVNDKSFDPFTEFPKLFGKLGMMPEVFSISLKDSVESLRLYAPRSIPVGLRDNTKAETDSTWALGVIESVEQPTKWCSGLIIAPKSNGKI